ncbi:polyamine aminopropyltransferase [Candidatus Haliotispira prima]|uniref:Polyamine aminopropyltransferase n=1 Tax=Candidatus Haliotispira prima TaxID=3034016 RepID=A0ABY8MEU7_9SPIO|nr:polyamine aminopropyltransferase [Candidatus Haliotispira prima]
MKRTLREKTPHNLILEYPELECIEELHSAFQHIAVYRHPELGKMLVHDNIVMLAETYEAAYHEMIAHVPLLHHPNPQRVLVIGGGDGGTSREVLRHPEVSRLVQVEIDGEVVRLSKRHFPDLASCYQDPRMELHIADGIRYMADCAEGRHRPFDIILVDSTDPKGAATGLFTETFYKNCRKSLKDDGILVIQGETFYGMAHVQKQILQILRQQFRDSGIYTSAIPFYPLGTWSLIYASERLRSEWQLRENALRNLAEAEQGLNYLNREIISACFALPNYALRLAGLQPEPPGKV